MDEPRLRLGQEPQAPEIVFNPEVLLKIAPIVWGPKSFAKATVDPKPPAIIRIPIKRLRISLFS
jgi:hypothetical protein